MTRRGRGSAGGGGLPAAKKQKEAFEFGPEHEAAAKAVEDAAGSLSHPQILAMVRDIQAAPGTEREKKARFCEAYPALALGYPVLFLAACRPGWDSSCLERMMGAIGAADTQEAADATVGDMLFGEYVRPVVGEGPPAPA